MYRDKFTFKEHGMTPTTTPARELVALLATLRDSILHSSVADGERPGLLDELGALEAAITRAATLPQGAWLPIDSAPKDALIIGHNELWVGAPSILEWDDLYQNWFIHDHGEQASPQPTFWMPVPPNPKFQRAEPEATP